MVGHTPRKTCQVWPLCLRLWTDENFDIPNQAIIYKHILTLTDISYHCCWSDNDVYIGVQQVIQNIICAIIVWPVIIQTRTMSPLHGDSFRTRSWRFDYFEFSTLLLLLNKVVVFKTKLNMKVVSTTIEFWFLLCFFHKLLKNLRNVYYILCVSWQASFYVSLFRASNKIFLIHFSLTYTNCVLDFS